MNKSEQQFELDDEFIDHILTLPEGMHIDFKRVDNVNSIIKTACAMANTEGGFIFVGIADGRQATGRDRVLGIEANEESFGNIQRDLPSRLIPPLQLPLCNPPKYVNILGTLCNRQSGRVVVIHISKSDAVHSLMSGGTYIRAGSQNRQLIASEITDLSLQRGVQSVVDAPVDVPIELLETDWWREYSDNRKLTRSIKQAIRHLGLAKKDAERHWKPTAASVLLFAEHPGGLLEKKCAIRIFHYRGHDIEYGENTNLARAPITIDGPVLYQIRQATDAVLNELNTGVHVSKNGFEFSQRYPSRVIQEAITNAVLHRDYRLSEDIHIRIFTNRIEIVSPGIFPGAVTTTNLREIGSKPRNRSLVDHLREFPKPPNLDAGEGVRMMFQTMEQDGLYPPVYKEERESREFVQVTLMNEARLSEWNLVEDYLRKHDVICNADVRKILNLGGKTAKASRLLKNWVNKDLLEIIDPVSTKFRKYRLKKAATSSDAFIRLFEELLRKGKGNAPDLSKYKNLQKAAFSSLFDESNDNFDK